MAPGGPDSTVWQSATIARRYLNETRAAIPLAGEQIATIRRLARGLERPVRRVLDLGCGDGVLGLALLEDFPGAEACFVDFSPTMLDAVRQNLAPSGGTYQVIQADYGQPGWQAAVGDAFDCIVSGFSIHHQPNTAKQRIYRELHALLAPGGLFLNLEHVASPSPWLEEHFTRLIVDAQYALPSNQEKYATRQELENAYRQRDDASANRLVSVEVQCHWLRKIGFRDVDCYLKLFELALFGGRKAGS